MQINYRQNKLEIDDARIIFRNFSGRPDSYTREGDRSFSVVIPNIELYEELVEAGWNVRKKEPRDEYDVPLMHLKVKVKYSDNGNGPGVYLRSGDSVTRLNEDTIGMLDQIIIESVDMNIRPYDWNRHGESGRTAYLESINVIQKVDRFGAMYASEGLL